jgi:replicative DNA helicase
VTDEPRNPQFNIDAEKAVLGCMMTADRAVVDAEMMLGKGDGFYLGQHRTIYCALLELRNRQEPTDPITLGQHLHGTGELARVGGAPYLHECVNAVPVAANVTHFARIVALTASLRALERQARKIMHAAQAAHYTDADSVLDQARGWLAELTATGGQHTDAVWLEAANRTYDELEEIAREPEGPVGIPTGLHDVDQVLEGLRPGQLTLVAARPRVGKSVLLLNVAQHAAMKLGKRVLLNTLEMSESEVTTRMFSAGTKVHLTKVRTPRLLADEEWVKLARYLVETAEAP